MAGTRSSKLFQRHIAIPVEHGAWVFLLSPLLTGFVVSRSFNLAGLLLVGAALGGFFFRQPLTIAVKVLSKRRPKSDLGPALFWMAVYGAITAISSGVLLLSGHIYLLFLAVPALPVLIWNLWLVSRRAERRQPVVEIAGSGVLALTAPAALWVSSGVYQPTGWILWGLFWLQGAASILYAYMRLEQRVWDKKPAQQVLVKTALNTFLMTTVNLFLVFGFSITNLVPGLLPLAFCVQWFETIWGAFNPAVQVKPTQIGIRQLIVSSIFTVVFILAYLFYFFELPLAALAR